MGEDVCLVNDSKNRDNTISGITVLTMQEWDNTDLVTSFFWEVKKTHALWRFRAGKIIGPNGLKTCDFFSRKNICLSRILAR